MVINLEEALDALAKVVGEYCVQTLVGNKVPFTPDVGVHLLSRLTIVGQGLAERCHVKPEAIREYLLAVALASCSTQQEATQAAKSVYEKIEARKNVAKAEKAIIFPGVFATPAGRKIHR